MIISRVVLDVSCKISTAYSFGTTQVPSPSPAKHCVSEDSEPGTSDLTITATSASKITLDSGSFSNFLITERKANL